MGALEDNADKHAKKFADEQKTKDMEKKKGISCLNHMIY